MTTPAHQDMAEAETLEGRIEQSDSNGQSSQSSLDRYRVPYSSYISNEQHEGMRNKVENWLLENHVCSFQDLERIGSKHKTIINEHRWEMMRDNPDQYWAMVYAYALGPSKEKGMIFSRLNNPFLSNPENHKSLKLYYSNQLAWDCVGICLFRNKYQRDPTTEEENAIAIRNSPIYRAAYAIWRGITGKELTYSWVDEVVNCERARKIQKKTDEGGRTLGDGSIIGHCSVCQQGSYPAGACAA